MRRACIFGGASNFLLALAVCGADQPLGKFPPGTLVIVGGGTMPGDVRDEFIKRAGGANAKLVVIPTASATADGAEGAKSLDPWKKYKLRALTLLHTRDRKKAD